jgi:hypothetical protein
MKKKNTTLVKFDIKDFSFELNFLIFSSHDWGIHTPLPPPPILNGRSLIQICLFIGLVNSV